MKGRSIFSKQQLARRARSVPEITYPAELPVSAHRDQIVGILEKSQVLILCGETGSGKTTQLPKMCLEMGRGISGMIGHTQPRRLAARTVAERIATELDRPLGDTVGYQVRFTDEVGPNTLVKLMTDGILLTEIQSDPLLHAYDTIIVDEAHERSLNIDFILGYLAQLLPKRPDLKVIITSATIDADRFSQAFANSAGEGAPILDVSGRTYPVEIRYRPLHMEHLVEKGGDIAVIAEPIDQETGICQAVDELLEEPEDGGPADILVFLPGERDIRDTEAALLDHLGARGVKVGEKPKVAGALEILPLYARLSAAEQRRVFEPHHLRRIVLATNVAETSLTVPGIRYVIDPGLARISRFSSRTKVQRLPIEPVSKASANQRSGRCGRLAAGVAIRLYSEDDFAARPDFTEPEILRTSLASVILQMASLGLGDVAKFPFLDAPSARAIRDGRALLFEVGAFSATGKLTRTGRTLARLPIDPRLGKMLLEANKLGCVSEVLVIVAALSMQDIRERPLEHQEASDQAHRRFADTRSDFITYLNLWRYIRVQSRRLSGAAFRRLARREFLHYMRIREWQDVVGQLRSMLRELKITVHRLEMPEIFEDDPDQIAAACVRHTAGPTTTDADSIHKAILAGLLSNLGSWDVGKKDYQGARNSHFVLWPGSALRGTHPDWVMAAELVETSRLFARTVAKIQPEWVEPLAKNLVASSYGEPYWSARAGAAMTTEKITLYGMTLIADRKRKLTSIGEDELARQMFIRCALVEGQWQEHHKFMEANAHTIERAREIEKRRRETGLLASDDALFAFFDERIPAEVTDQISFNKWWKTARQTDPKLLNFALRDVLAPGAETAESSVLDKKEFPDHLVINGVKLPLTYVFHPGATDDGVTATVPIEVLARLRPEPFDWLVPGFLADLCAGIIRALPKNHRRQLLPALQVGSELAQWLRHGNGSVTPAEVKEAAALDKSLARLTSWLDQQEQGSVASTSLNKTQKRAKTTQKGDSLRNLPHVPTATTGKKDTPNTQQIKAGQGSLPLATEAAVRAVRAVRITAKEIETALEQLPDHLRMRFVVIDASGKPLGVARDLAYLQRNLHGEGAHAVRDAVSAAVAQTLQTAGKGGKQKGQNRPVGAGRRDMPSCDRRGRGTSVIGAGSQSRKQTAGVTDFIEVENLDSWPRDIPASVATRSEGGWEVRAFPALVDPHAPVRPDLPPTPGTGIGGCAVGKVSLRLLTTAGVRDREHRLGVIRLLLSDLALATKRVTSRWSGAEAALLATAPYPSSAALVEDAQWAALAAIVDEVPQRLKNSAAAFGGQLPHTAASYGILAGLARDLLEERTYQVLRAVAGALDNYGQVRKQLAQTNALSALRVAEEERTHAHALIYPGFVARTPPLRLPHLQRYLAASLRRLRRGDGNPRTVAQYHQIVAEVQQTRERSTDLPWQEQRHQRLVLAETMVEELRVQTFAQNLGTAMKVSPKRIRALLQS
ncbi:MAG: ATP-dependent RNA helicase HrpA [Actinomycetaceae bacterium]|nr:ATP-dependent RNA helicase HrpA [Actinomycetaceae bacterium]